jgi:hypothetical protein
MMTRKENTFTNIIRNQNHIQILIQTMNIFDVIKLKQTNKLK